MKKILLALSIGIISLTALQAQHQSCGFDQTHQQAIEQDPELAKVFQANEQEIQRIISRNLFLRLQKITTIFRGSKFNVWNLKSPTQV